MLTFEEVGAILDDIADELPEEFYKNLNGGIVLLPDVKIHSESRNPATLYILGQYIHDLYGLGRYIAIYYGSFINNYGHAPPEIQKNELRRVLLHEFTHHIESLSGERGLEIKDEIKMNEYRRRFGN